MRFLKWLLGGLASVFTFLMVISFTNPALAGSWNSGNDPSIFSDQYVYNFKALPLKGTLPADQIPWSETYWASAQGSINIRWNSETQVGFGYRSPTKSEAMRMSKAELAELSPTEKYDLFMGRYDYPLKEEVKMYADPHAKSWAGLCHGWAPVSLQYKEPQPVEMMNPDGILIPFGSSDIKGLMIFATAIHNDLDTVQVGLKCNPMGWRLQTANCKDVNAGSLHVILANQLGLNKEGFVAERDPGGEIWNQAVYGYEFSVVGSASPSTRDASSAVQIHAIMNYTDELDHSLWEPVTGTAQFKSDKLVMDYVLDLDSRGNIVGGEFIGRDHPDFLWKATKKATFTDYLAGINRLYRPVGQN